ncbi:putative MFS transporter [Sphaerosporella brunnea]|uniref:Putative MFS transporter n=1 Tax=Sphaerosporella brunnea TaxID=1250544 RepID=A0A5J5F972_9PEZI|nr:putative MFS transporter [Sphaerosporella brunnea]
MNRDPEIARQVEDALNIDIIPGTEVMAQVAGLHLVENESHDVLVPQPSSNPDDPLNWNPFWKGITMATMISTAFLQAFGPLAIAPQAPAYMKEWDRSLADVLRFTGVCILVLGFSNFIWVPLSTTFGRRWALILAAIVSFVACIWRATANSYNHFLGACILHGIGAGPAETIPPVLIADVKLLKDRGFWMNVYTWSYFGSLMVGPIISGVMTDRLGWRSFWWLNVGLYGAMIVFLVLLHPETHYDRRDLPVSDGQQTEPSDASIFEKPAVALSEGTTSPKANVDEVFGKGAPTRAQFLAFRKRGTWKELVLSLWIPIKLFSFPIVEWTSFAVSWSASAFLMVNLTQSQAFAAPPYNMSSTSVGLTNLAPLVGGTIGMFIAGPSSDWVSMRSTRKNNGIREPEMRLPTLLPFLLCCLVGALVTAYGYQNTWRWEIIVIIGYTLLGLQVSAISAIAMTYSIDSYKPVAGEILVSATVNKNLWGYGVAEFMTNWVISAGYVTPMVTIMGTHMAICLFAVPLYFWGKNLRRITKDSNVHSL